MDSQDLRNLQEAYNNVYEATGLLGTVDKVARNTAGTVGGVIGREKASKTPGANLPIIGGMIKNEGERRGRQQGQQMYDKAKETVGGLLKQDYEFDNFDIILEYLVAESYADTNENALVIMANMSEEWKKSIIDEMAMNPKSRFVTSVQRKDYAANQIGSKEFSDRGGYAALKAGGGQAALKSGRSVSDVLHAGKRATQQKEGPYISPESKARTNLMNAQAEKLRRETTAKKPMDDFAAGGGNAKMKATGMTRDQVIAQGKKNLAQK